jgi:two-component sensor histidine kinase
MSGGSLQNWRTRLGEHPLLRRQPIPAYAVAVVLVALALGLRFVLGDLLVGVPFITFYSVVAISAFIGGWITGALATGLSALGGLYFLAAPPHSVRVEPLSDAFAISAFALTCALIVLLTHIAVRAAETNAQLARQRQILLMELQHRIKNHLQLLGAMLATHSRATTNERIRARLEEAGRRLQVIAATYDNLYEPGALIDMSDHLRKVCTFVEGGVASRKSKITVDSVTTSWPVERVIPLSLIANELLTNSVKHALPDTDLAVDVRLTRQNGQMRFSVETLNTQLPDDFNVNTSGVGLKIASMLAQQLGGQLKTPRLPAASFVVEFPEYGVR